MKKCWFFNHEWKRDREFEFRWQKQSYVNIRAYVCVKCNHTKVLPAGTDI